MSKHTPPIPENAASTPAGGTWLALALAVLSGLLYWLTRCPGHTPGMPSIFVTSTLPSSPMPDILHPIWGLLVEWTHGNASLLTAFSAACGVLCVFLTTILIMRVRHPIHDREDDDEVRREWQGRLLGGVTAGLFLALSMPVWMAATRTMPDLFHLALLLLPAWLLSEYRRAGGPWRLLALGALLGVGLVEYPTTWMLAPVAAILVSRAMLQRASFRWRDLLMVGLFAFVAAAVVGAWAIWRSMRFEFLSFNGIDGYWRHFVHYFKTEGAWFRRALGGTGFLLTLTLTVFPWVIVYVFRSGKPAWRHREPLVILHLLVLAACEAVLWEAPVTAWHIHRLAFLAIAPLAILSSCLGFLAGDFWIMGQLREHRAAGVGQPMRSALGLVALCMPLSVLAAGVWHWPAVSSRCAPPLIEAVGSLVEALPADGVILGDGVLDDLAEAQGLARGRIPAVVRAAMSRDPVYRAFLADRLFPDPRHRALLDLGLAPFLQEWLQTPDGRARMAFLNTGESFRNLGELVPDGLLCRMEPSAPSGDALTGLIEAQMPFWKTAAGLGFEGPVWMRKRAARDNPVVPFLDYLKRLASKQANDTAFWLLDDNRADEAEALLLLSREIFPGNVSALLNLLNIAQKRGETDSPYRAEWEAYIAKNRDNPELRHLAEIYGKIHDTSLLIRQGIMWAFSGQPRRAEADLRRVQPGGPRARLNADLSAFLGRLYLAGHDLELGEEHYRAILAENPNDANARLFLAKAAIQRGELAEARAALDRLVADGVPRAALTLDYALIQASSGDPRGAIELLGRAAAANPDDFLSQAVLLILARNTGDETVFRRAWENLRRRPAKSIPLRLTLAQVAVQRNDWSAAREELEQLVRMNPANAQVWELLLQADFAERRRELAEDHVRRLLTLDPGNPFGNAVLASFQRERGQYALAEASLRACIAANRAPGFLNDLADVLLRRARLEKRPELVSEALSLVEESLDARPGDLTSIATRAEIYLELNRLDEAEADINVLLSSEPDNPLPIVLAAEFYIRRGNLPAATELLDHLQVRRDELPAVALEQIRALRDRIEQASPGR